jgi:hypothetical protein
VLTTTSTDESIGASAPASGDCDTMAPAVMVAELDSAASPRVSPTDAKAVAAASLVRPMSTGTLTGAGPATVRFNTAPCAACEPAAGSCETTAPAAPCAASS